MTDGAPLFLQGNEAIVEGALAAGIGFYGGYPITPASEIAEILSRRLPQQGGVFIQMEDEIASLAAVIGASVGGLKAATATKLVLNMLTVASMVRLGKVYGNLMVDVRPTSRKLRERALRLIQTITGASRPRAAVALRRAGGDTKVAIVIAARHVDAQQARRLLARHDGRLRPIIDPCPLPPASCSHT